MELTFIADTPDALNAQIKDYVSKLKGTRGGKAGDDTEVVGGATTGNAPAPIMPPQGGGPAFNPGGFAAPGVGAAPQGGGFPAAGAQIGPAPEIVAMVQRINARIDWCLTPTPNGGGQDPNAILTWFRGQCGPEAANYTLDQIRQVMLPRMTMPGLDGIAKLMNA